MMKIPAIILILTASLGSCTTSEWDDSAGARCEPVFLLGTQPVVPDTVFLTEATPGRELFRLCVVPQTGWDLDNFALRLVFDGREWPFERRHGLPSRGGRHLGVWIEETDVAEALGISLGIPVAKRADPKPYAVTAEFFPESETFPAGSRIPIRLKLVNSGSSAVRIAQCFPSPGSQRHPNFTIRVTCDGELMPETEPEGDLIGIGNRRVLNPGDVLEERIFVNDWVSPDRTGAYIVDMVYSLEMDGTPWPFDTTACCATMCDNYVDCFRSEVRFTVE